jgi:CheY-like chemotaxis protein
VYGDSGRLQQVVWNLLANAIKFTPKGGRIQLVLERVNSHAEIRVADSGQGIAPEFLPYIFDRFRQADAGSTKQHGGLGLGLSIVKQLVELHGGTVAATSPGVGRGATFVVTLPMQSVQTFDRATTQHSYREADEFASSDVSLKNIRVLVVDDELDSRELVRRLLTDRGAEVTLASSVDEALAAFAAQPPDVLLSDIGMPDKDGYDLIRGIRALGDGAGSRVPAIAVTALARADDRKRAMLAGFQTHISKPVDPGELIAVVASLAGLTGR